VEAAVPSVENALKFARNAGNFWGLTVDSTRDNRPVTVAKPSGRWG
jgi:hypothetical protein